MLLRHSVLESNSGTKKKKKTLTKKQLTALYLTMGQFEERERRTGDNHRARCALYPTWYWLTVLDTLRYTGMRQNQLLHIRLGDIDLHERRIILCSEGFVWTILPPKQTEETKPTRYRR